MMAIVKAGFSKRIAKATANHAELMLAVHNKKNEQALRTILTEQYVMLAVVLWETYLNDLFIAYAMDKPSTVISSLEKRIASSIGSKFGQYAATCVKFAVRKPITRQTIVSLLDPKNWNITASSSKDLATKANEILHATFAKRFSLDKADSQFLDFAIAVRNFLSHRSGGSRTTLRNALNLLSEPANDFLTGGNTANFGTYLKTPCASGKSRAIELVNRLAGVAEKL